MGFWDRRQAELLRHWNIGDPLPELVTDDHLNPVLEPYWQQLKPEVTGPMAVDGARELDKIIESLSEEKAEAIVSLGLRFMLTRSNHRKEHIDQIEEAL